MELRNYFTIFRKWLWLIILGGLLAAGSAFVFSILSAPVYQSTITLLVNEGSNPVSDPYNAILTSQRAAATYVEQIKSPVVLNQVIRDLNLPFDAREMTGMLTVQLVRDTQLVRVSIEDTSPERAQAIATQIAKVFVNFAYSLQQSRYQASRKDLDQQISDVRKKIDDTQKALVPLGDPNDPKYLSAPEFVRTERLRLQMELTTYQSQYTVLLKSQQDFSLAASRYVDSIVVSSPAEIPEVPVRPRVSLNTLLGLVVGLMLGVGTAFLIEYLDDTMKSSADVQRVLDLSTLGAIVTFPGNPADSRKTLITVDSPGAPYAEAYRNLRTNLQFSLLGDAAVALTVTSAVEAEGKTTTIANLGVVMAQMGKRVLLVDTDLRRPTLNKYFGLPAQPGLTNLLLGQIQNIDAVLNETAVPGLRVLCAGPVPPNPAELLASNWMDKLIQALKQRADIVLFDAPPVLPVTDAALLAAKTGNLLWIVAAGKTRTDALRRTREALAQVETKILGVVLNRVSATEGYGYYYYHYYSSDDQEKKASHSLVEDLLPPFLRRRAFGNQRRRERSATASPEKFAKG
ncbi:MAG: polysaccharide biosynthesis tyrosine autokinase [Chloroflexi bacterium]|nr:polysaccharide biosynthesis tyrosine autokinase [Chloroflexota bacterium]